MSKVTGDRLNLLYWAFGEVTNSEQLHGVDEEEFVRRCANVSKMEMFMNTLNQPAWLTDYPNLKELQLHVQNIPQPIGLHRMSQLQRLCMTEVRLQTMRGIESCTQLIHLDLSSNSLTKMDPTVLGELTNLRTLWLNENPIAVIQGTESLTRLHSLWLARTHVSYIGDKLDSNVALTDLNLAASAICNFKDIPSLVHLRLLSSLSFADGHFGDSPVCNLCNYQTYILFHLQQLNVLDSLIIAEESRQIAEATYMKKKMYYNMRIKTFKRNTSNVLRRLAETRQARISQVNLNLNVLLRQKKDVQRQLDDLEVAGLAATDADVPLLRDKIATLDRGIESKMSDIARTVAAASHVHQEVCDLSQSSINRLLVELETGGNIRLEDGKPSDVWYSSCVDLVMSRFVAADFVTCGIDGVRVRRVTRIHNRMLRNRFEEHLEGKVNTSDPSYKRSLEYLFYGEHPELPGELTRVIEDGFRPVSEYQAGCGHAAVPLSNSVGICDKPRLLAVAAAAGLVEQAAQGCGSAAVAAAAELPHLAQKKLHSQLLITKVFLSRCTQAKGAMDQSVCQEDYDGFSSVYRPVEAEGKQREWYVFEPALVLPEYLVELEYTATGAKPDHEPTAQQLVELGGGIGATLHSEAEAVDLASLARPLLRFAQQCTTPTATESYDDACTAALNMPPPLKEWSKVTRIDDEVLRRCAHGKPLSDLTRLNLHGNAISAIECMGKLSNLRELVLCFNEISKLEGLNNMPNLERLELGFNLIKRIEGLGHLPKVRHLELNNNLIYRLDDASALQKCVPKVQELNLHNNAVCELKGYRTHVLRKLNELTVLDGITVETGERESASDTSRSITVDLLKTHGHSRRRPVSSFGRGARSQEHPETQSSIEARSPNDLVRGGGDDGRWWDEIEELDLDHFHLRKLHDLERLVHLRRASFCNNELMRIEGLENCVHLQELSLEDNKITKLENVDALVRLTKLELGKNRITRIEGLETLTALTQLSLEDNEISSLTGLSSLTSLMELYIGNNRIAELKEVQQLRTLPKLIILDISGNELCRTTDSRSYVIFHLRKLKVLDGIGIDLREMNIAKERFAGRLTQEALVERLGHSYFEHVLELDLSRSKIRELEALHAYAPSFCNMRELNLDLNLIADGGAIPFLPALTVLRLNHNQISTIPLPPASGSWKGIICLAALEVLQLGFNQIVDIPSLHVNRLPNLKVLHLQGNEITRVEGLTDMPQLRELILDRNKIKALDAQSISSLSSLRELRIEENGLRTLEYVANLPHLTTLAIGTNRIADIPELEKLDGLPSLQHLALANNGVARKQLYRPTLVRQLPSLRLIDAREVTHEERERAEIIFNADARPNIASADPTTTRGFATKVPLKLTSMNFEMMAGLGGGPGGGLGGGLGIASIGAPGDIRGNPPHGFGNQRSDRNLHGESASADWHPISGGHDNFFHQQGRGRGLGRSVGSGRTAGSSTDRRPYR